MEISKNINICKLIDCYGDLMKENQIQLLKGYYFDNLSLTELADIQGVSRQAISESLNTSVSKLQNYEKVIGKLKIAELITSMTIENFEQTKQNLIELI